MPSTWGPNAACHTRKATANLWPGKTQQGAVSIAMTPARTWPTTGSAKVQQVMADGFDNCVVEDILRPCYVDKNNSSE